MSTPNPEPVRRPPFSPAAARALRAQLRMTPEQVADGMAAFGVHLTPAHVLAFEYGGTAPGEQELAALAGALWCDRSDLTGRAQTLRSHRRARGLGVQEAAGILGVSPDAYTRMEDENLLRAPDQRRARLLAEALHLPVRDAVELSGDLPRLRETLVQAVQGWWKGHGRTVCALVPLPRADVLDALRRVHGEYQSLSAGSANWSRIFAGEDEPASDARARAWLEDVLDHFWRAVDATSSRTD